MTGCLCRVTDTNTWISGEYVLSVAGFLATVEIFWCNYKSSFRWQVWLVAWIYLWINPMKSSVNFYNPPCTLVCSGHVRTYVRWPWGSKHRELVLDLFSHSKKILWDKYDSDRLLNKTDFLHEAWEASVSEGVSTLMTFPCNINF